MTRIVVVVGDLERAARAHAAVYGIERWRVSRRPAERTAEGSDAHGTAFRLVQPAGGDGPFAAFLARRGEGIGGLGLAVGRAAGPEALGGCAVEPAAGAPDAADEEWDLGGGALQPAPRVAHAGVVVRDLDQRSASWDRVFGPLGWRFTRLRPAPATLDGHPVEHEFRLARAEVGGLEIELIEPTVEPTHYRREFLDRFGEGVHHLLLWPALTEAEWPGLRRWMESNGAPVVTSGAVRSGGAEYFYLDTRRLLGGYLVEAILRRD